MKQKNLQVNREFGPKKVLVRVKLCPTKIFALHTDGVNTGVVWEALDIAKPYSLFIQVIPVDCLTGHLQSGYVSEWPPGKVLVCPAQAW